MTTVCLTAHSVLLSETVGTGPCALRASGDDDARAVTPSVAAVEQGARVDSVTAVGG